MAEGKSSRRDRSPRKRRSRSTSRDRDRDRDHSRDRHRHKDRDRHRRHDRDDRHHDRSRRDRDHRHHRDRSRSRGRTPEKSRDALRAQGPDPKAAYQARFASAGHVFEDNGGLPVLEQLDQGHYADMYQGYSSYEAALEAGLDGTLNDAEQDEYFQGRRGRGHERPSATIYVRGLPEDAEEGELFKLLEPWPGVQQVRITRDRGTGLSRGFAFADFESEDAAGALMESEARYALQLRGRDLRLEYSHTPPAAGSTGGAGEAPLDWQCEMCNAVNFSRRLECYQCSTPRSKNARRVSMHPEGPSNILKVSGLEPHASEEALHALFSTVAPVRDVRLVRDKFSAAPRGFAFVHYAGVAEAAKALQVLQGAALAGQATPLRLAFAKDRVQPASNEAAADALAAAQAMQLYSGWEPREFDESAVDPQPADEARQAEAAAAQGEPSMSAPAGGAEANGQPQAQDGFQYDPQTGYYLHASSGYYYDANSGLYFNSQSQQWMAYDAATGTYTAYPTAAEGAPVQDEGPLVAPEISSTPSSSAPAKSVAEKRRGAVIGAPPQLNSVGLWAAAEAAQAKLEELQGGGPKRGAKTDPKRKAAGRGATLSRPAAVRGGIGVAAAPPMTSAEAAAATGGPVPMAQLQAPTVAVQPAAAAVLAAGGGVRGVIHVGKWGKR